MTIRAASRRRGAVALASGFMLLVAACGSDSKSEPSVTTAAPTATTAAPATTGGGATTPSAGSSGGTETTAGSGTETTTGSGTETTAGSGTGSAGCEPVDTSFDATRGTDAGLFKSDLECAAKKPLKAEGDPITIGFQNPEGDPNGSFPEFSLAAQSAVDYINSELGGLGSDIQNGKPGRPIKLEICKMAISPDDSQRCANELIAKKPTLVFSSLNFFGNHFPIYAAAQIPAVVITPITVGDFSSPNVYSIGAGGGCLGVHTGLVKYAVQDLKATKLAIPWSDTPPGVVCYYDLEAKPADVLAGNVKGSSPDAGSVPDLTYLGVPIKPASPDVTAQATQILDFKPNAIIYSAQGADCWNFVSALGRLGWTPSSIPLVLSGACIDFDAMKSAGDLAKGIYFVGSTGTTLQDLSTLTDPYDKFEATIYQSKPAQYGLAADQLNKGFATQGFSGVMSLWELSTELAADGKELTSETFAEAYKTTADQHLFGSTPLSCSTAPAPYVAVCNASVAVTQWDGTKLDTVVPLFSGIDLVAGTEIKPGP